MQQDFSRSPQMLYQKAKHLRMKENVLRKKILKDRVVTKPGGTYMRLYSHTHKHTCTRTHTLLQQKEELNYLKGIYLSASPTSNPISENGAPTADEISSRKQRKLHFGHI